MISLCFKHDLEVRYYKARYCCFIHYFATTHAAVVGNFIVCKSTTSVTRIFLLRHDATTFRFLKSIDWPMEQALNLSKKKDSCGQGINVKEKEESIVLLLTLK